MPDLTWKPCDHEHRTDVREVADPPWPQQLMCLGCGARITVQRDGAESVEELQSR